MIPREWESKTTAETNKAAYRNLPANICAFMCLTMVICFDQGLCKMITTRQCMDQQKKTTTEKQRRTFLNIVYRTKLALCRLYTDHMDPVDIKDHHWVMNRECCCCYRAAACSLLLTAGHLLLRLHAGMVLTSWKWTWSPILLVFDTIKTNVYTQHVLLCADYNERNNLNYNSADYLRPYPSKEFYRILGLKMMKYRANAGYWFESKESREAAKRKRTNATSNPASTRASPL